MSTRPIWWIPWDLIARVYPSYPLPGIDSDGWEAAAWDDLCDLLRKNKTKIGNARIRADLTGSGRIGHPTGALWQLRDRPQESFRSRLQSGLRGPVSGVHFNFPSARTNFGRGFARVSRRAWNPR
jgi:hypothetical protein